MTVVPRELSGFTAAACLLAAAAFVVGATGNAPPLPRSARYENLLSFFRAPTLPSSRRR